MSVSDELRRYPKDLLQSPLDVTAATATFSPGGGAGVAPATRSGRALDARVAVRAVSAGGFASLIGRDRLPVGVVLVSLLVAMFWGAAHALSPGHGKSIVAAYLVGTRGTRRDAVVLGLAVTVTHTIGVFARRRRGAFAVHALVWAAVWEVLVPSGRGPDPAG